VGASVGAAAPVVSQTPAPEPSTPNFDHLFAPVANPTPIAPASANPNQTVPAPSAQSSSANQADEEVKVLGKKFKVKNLIFGIVIVIILFFTIGVFLTEDGIISIGLEKIYGAVNLQSLWGGLPENSETALAISANQMKSESNFQISGTATVTANAGIKSNIVGPLVAGIVSSISSQSSQANVSELDATISAGVSGDVTGADLGIKSAANQKTKMNLIYAKNRMYVKTTDDISYDANSASGWVYWDLANPPAGGPAGDIFSGNYSGSTFSASGSRVGNEIVDGVHCYHYQANINLGDLLDSFGLTSSSVESIDSNFWIGVKDKRLHQITMKIIPGKSSALTRIDLTLNLNNFGAGGGNYIIPATATPAGSNAAALDATSRDKLRKSGLTSIAKALSDYFAANGSYPVSSASTKISTSQGLLYENLVPTYISALPLDPLPNSYYYGYMSTGISFTLSAALEVQTDADGTMTGGKNIYFLKSQ
ncbi:MAG: hypothetical protein NTW79_00270, partial [Candidatus Berkelbacteria bacterium]|nr:hypothetical protein [Candidatus Berkelbacteria bacterium]